jgi:hypothetical protein
MSEFDFLKARNNGGNPLAWELTYRLARLPARVFSHRWKSSGEIIQRLLMGLLLASAEFMAVPAGDSPAPRVRIVVASMVEIHAAFWLVIAGAKMSL